MSRKLKIAIISLMLLGTASSAALAEGYDPNLANRYPGYAAADTYGYVVGANPPTRMHSAPHATLQSAPVYLRQEAPGTLTGNHPGYYSGNHQINVDSSDHASSPYAGGGF
jgi:hypothetical protein